MGDFGAREALAKRGAELVDWLRGFLREQPESMPNLTRADLDAIVKAYDARVGEIGADPRELLSHLLAARSALDDAHAASAALVKRLEAVEAGRRGAEEALTWIATVKPCGGPHCAHPGACRCTCRLCVERRMGDRLASMMTGR